jgi:hypothetical protein
VQNPDEDEDEFYEKAEDYEIKPDDDDDAKKEK